VGSKAVAATRCQSLIGSSPCTLGQDSGRCSSNPWPRAKANFEGFQAIGTR
jgi:hypothetical protein